MTADTVASPKKLQPHQIRKKIVKHLRLPNPPKRPMSAYNFFLQQQRAAAASMHEQWARLSPRERNRYERMAQEDAEQYRREMNAFNKRMNFGPRRLSPNEVTPEAKDHIVWTTPMMAGVPPPQIPAAPPAPAASPYQSSHGVRYSQASRRGVGPSHPAGISTQPPNYQNSPHDTPTPRSPPSARMYQPSRPHMIPTSPQMSAYPHPYPAGQPAMSYAGTPTGTTFDHHRDVDYEHEHEHEHQTSNNTKLTGPPPMSTVPLPSDTQMIMTDPVTGNLQKYKVSYAVWTMPESSAQEYLRHVLSKELDPLAPSHRDQKEHRHQQQGQQQHYDHHHVSYKPSGMVSIPRTVTADQDPTVCMTRTFPSSATAAPYHSPASTIAFTAI
eukprot:CAMPEP_0194032572 /NCGR_PEP_ID=MMETSP0009_2-20130614/5488_1 /TAXON_ID=210454 /ORGANISM="Grammatophora oceanica, Strain CCMP 410" /LENGTH=383 /DNA_ID=CAMNT_0038673057 /DNA_START=59 /DNA_END=1210 /DNA_ORIENTATION=-